MGQAANLLQAWTALTAALLIARQQNCWHTEELHSQERARMMQLLDSQQGEQLFL
jgi:hypothetical protein